MFYIFYFRFRYKWRHPQHFLMEVRRVAEMSYLFVSPIHLGKSHLDPQSINKPDKIRLSRDTNYLRGMSHVYLHDEFPWDLKVVRVLSISRKNKW